MPNSGMRRDLQVLSRQPTRSNRISRFAAFRAFATSHFELQQGNGRVVPMEGLRGFSAIIVFFVHFEALFGARAGHSPAHDVSLFLATIGHCGVDIFFALSGFLMYGAVMKRPYGYFHFVQRRIHRLYPTFLAILMFYLLVSAAIPAYSRFPATPGKAALYLLANVLMLPGIFPIVPIITVAWSLSYELFYYLTLPLIIRGLRIFRWTRSWRVGFFFTMSAAQLLLCSAGLSQHPRLIMFGCGILIRETCDMGLRFSRAADYLALALLVTVLAVTGVSSDPVFAAISGPVLQRSGLALALLFVSVYAVCCCAFGHDGLLSSIFSMDWLRWMGNMSYSYYLAHGVILHLLRIVLEYLHLPAHLISFQYLALGGVSFVATVAGAAIVFLAVERRFSFTGVGPAG